MACILILCSLPTLYGGDVENACVCVIESRPKPLESTVNCYFSVPELLSFAGYI